MESRKQELLFTFAILSFKIPTDDKLMDKKTAGKWMARGKQELLFLFCELSSEIWITCYHQPSCCDFKSYLSAECRGKQKLHVGQLRWILGPCELHPQGLETISGSIEHCV